MYKELDNLLSADTTIDSWYDDGCVIGATKPRSSEVAGVNPAWKGASHTTNNESWSVPGNKCV